MKQLDHSFAQAVELYKRGEKFQASKILSVLLKEDPKNASAWYGLALCLDETDRKIYGLQKVLEFNPNHAKAQNALEKLKKTNTSMFSDLEEIEFVDSPKAEDLINSRDYKNCPYCAERIKLEATVCRFCGRDLIHREVPMQLISIKEAIQIVI